MLLLGFIRPSTSLKIFDSDAQNWAQVAAKEALVPLNRQNLLQTDPGSWALAYLVLSRIALSIVVPYSVVFRSCASATCSITC